MAYEKMKAWGFEQKRRQAERMGKPYNQDLDKLVSGLPPVAMYFLLTSGSV
jgi:hypothetical protein